VKKAPISPFFFVVALSVCFSFARANATQERAVADPGVGASQSANYLYDHGTLWFEDESVEEPPAPTPTPPPTGGGGGSGSGSGSGGSSGGSSGSGWLTSLFGGNSQIGGISPEADVPFTDTPAVTAVVVEIPRATQAAVRVVDAPTAITRALKNPQYRPHIVRLVDDAGVTRELNIVLFKRIVPWPLWIALILILLGVLALILYIVSRGTKESLLWIGGVLILVGIVTGIVVRFAYHAVPIDPTIITSINAVSVKGANEAVIKLMTDMPLGTHVITASDTSGATVLTIKVFITPALPI
jgi:hypothetical protein